MMDDNEKFWVGSKAAWLQRDYHVNRMQASDGKLWLEDVSGLRLDPDYSEYSVRIYHPTSRTLSFVLSTVAIIPKSLVRRVFNLLGEFLYGS